MKVEPAAATVTLSHGCLSGRERHRVATVRALTGADEIAIATLETSSAAARVTALLARAVERLGPIQPVGSDVTATLTVGDREALVLHVRRLTLGDRLACMIRCPQCREPMDLDLRVSDLLLPSTPDEPVEHELDLDDGGTAYHVSFRLPTGADLEDAATVAARDGIAEAARRILRRCVARVTCGGDTVSLPSRLERVVSTAMASRDPQAELMLRPLCPSCGAHFEALLDAASFLFDEIGARVRTLFGEVHLLARHYHWSEAEILSLSPARRHAYLSLIGEESNAKLVR
jgi:hypothetical protein